MNLLREYVRNILLEKPQTLNNVVVIDHDNPPPSGDSTIDSIVVKILSGLDPRDLQSKYRKLHGKDKGGCDPLTGFCRITSEVFWELVSELEGYNHNYKPCRIVHDSEKLPPDLRGVHFFIKDIKTGHIVDLTAGQFRDSEGNHVRVPYENGVCDTESKRSASLGWANRKKGKNWVSKAMPGFQLGTGASATMRRIKGK
ncbi:MAG: hypothetical protein CMA72_07110 [Euryarchaeota archaeon]|nr:hypothetical protein [Euryarchaeota archaeon]|tara:strand:+ start:42525 stop:43121 length:597 start_codon:yes stop_codon:yes gene_type:complete